MLPQDAPDNRRKDCRAASRYFEMLLQYFVYADVPSAAQPRSGERSVTLCRIVRQEVIVQLFVYAGDIEEGCFFAEVFVQKDARSVLHCCGKPRWHLLVVMQYLL